MIQFPPVQSYEALVSRLRKASAAVGAAVETLVVLHERGREYPMLKISLGNGNARRALISAGIHGDEPAGVETVCRFLEDRPCLEWARHWNLVLLPCINPTGYELRTREDHEGRDLNRMFRLEDPGAPVAPVQDLLNTPFLLDMELHEDVDSPGYYLYKKENLPTRSTLGRSILESVAPIMPLNLADEIEGLPAHQGLLDRLSEPEEMEWWPMAVCAYARGTRHVLTLETSTHFTMETRIQAHLTALRTAHDFFTEI